MLASSPLLSSLVFDWRARCLHLDKLTQVWVIRRHRVVRAATSLTELGCSELLLLVLVVEQIDSESGISIVFQVGETFLRTYDNLVLLLRLPVV